MLKAWWVCAFIIASITMQTLSNLWRRREFMWYEVFDVLKLLLYGAISAMGVFVDSEKDKFKMFKRESNQAVGTKEGYVKLIDDKSHHTMSYGSLNTVAKDSQLSFVARNRTSPEEKANFFSKATFWWTAGLLKLGWERALEQEDIWPLLKKDSSAYISAGIENSWREQLAAAKPSFAKALLKEYGLYFSLVGIFKLCSDVLVFVGPIILNIVIRFVQNPTWTTQFGLLMALAMFSSSALQTLFMQAYFYTGYRTGIRVRSAVVTTVYKKALTISSRARQKFSTG